jgi:methyl-accepting chemotaxis protein
MTKDYSYDILLAEREQPEERIMVNEKVQSRLSHSIKFRFILFFIIFFIAMCAIITAISLRQTIRVAVTIFAGQGAPIVQKTFDLIDGDKFEALAQSPDPRSPFYETVRRKMLEIKQTSNCQYLYTMAKVSDTVYMYIIDGSAPPDDDENFSALGAQEDVSGYDSAFFKTMETGTGQISSLTYQGEWGWVISMYLPIKNSRGTVVGIIGCDFEGEPLRALIIREIIRQTLVSIFFILIGILMIALFSRLIFVPLQRVSGPMQEIAAGEGDLTISIPVIKSDEMGILAGNFNKFVEKLREIMGNIMLSVNELTGSSEQLRKEAADLLEALGTIFKGIEEIRDQAQNQNIQAQISYDGVKQIEMRIDGLGDMLSTQLAAVEESSAAINQMTANIQSMTDNITHVSRRYEQLMKNAGAGREQQIETGNSISRIVEQTENLIEANTAINKIAARTNMLAMNAAIEAAHAGAAGRGFSVVAEEIRGLSETATEQSKSIREHIREIQNTVNLIVLASDKSAASFNSINADIEEVNNMIVEVHTAMSEQNTGIQEILAAVRDISDSAHSIHTAAGEMKDQSRPVFAGIDDLVKKTGVILEHSELSIGQTAEIRKLAGRVTQIADKNSSDTGNVLRIVKKFKI